MSRYLDEEQQIVFDKIMDINEWNYGVVLVNKTINPNNIYDVNYYNTEKNKHLEDKHNWEFPEHDFFRGKTSGGIIVIVGRWIYGQYDHLPWMRGVGDGKGIKYYYYTKFYEIINEKENELEPLINLHPEISNTIFNHVNNTFGKNAHNKWNTTIGLTLANHQENERRIKEEERIRIQQALRNNYNKL